MLLGPIREIVLLGGGSSLLREVSLWANDSSYSLKVITSPRHSEEKVDGQTLIDFLDLNNISYLVVADIDCDLVRNYLSDIRYSFVISLGAAWIFSEKIIHDVFAGRLFNLHGTALPKNRGGGTFSWQIMMGLRFGFCMLLRVDAGVDTGDIATYQEYLYPISARTPADYMLYYAKKNKDFIINFIEKYKEKPCIIGFSKQAEYLSSYWPRLSSEINGWIDWSLNAIELERFICAFDVPYSGAKTYLNKKTVSMQSVSLSYDHGSFHSYQSGLVYRKSNQWLCVALRECSLIVEVVRDEAGVSVFDDISLGDRFFTPHHKLDTSRDRVIYTSQGIKLK
jgi:methionyl-tRNA formyltransferase